MTHRTNKAAKPDSDTVEYEWLKADFEKDPFLILAKWERNTALQQKITYQRRQFHEFIVYSSWEQFDAMNRQLFVDLQEDTILAWKALACSIHMLQRGELRITDAGGKEIPLEQEEDEEI
jgi:hypothetical protein